MQYCITSLVHVRKTLFVIVSLLATSFIHAQKSSDSSLTSKKKEPYLPAIGSWSIGIDAAPLLTYFGNIFSGNTTTNNSPAVSFLNSTQQTIIGKYYVDDHTAYRFLAKVGYSATTQTINIPSDDTSQATPAGNVEDRKITISHFIALGVGLEKRKGNTRLQGLYGLEWMFYNAGGNTLFIYGNPYTYFTNTNPTWYNWNTNSIAAGLPRYTQFNPGETFGMNVVGFIGFEYFISAQISLSAEYTTGIWFYSINRGNTELEEISPNGIHEYTITQLPGNTGISFDNGLNQGIRNSEVSIYFNFTF